MVVADTRAEPIVAGASTKSCGSQEPVGELHVGGLPRAATTASTVMLVPLSASGTG
jgi:hypothetical protein